MSRATTHLAALNAGEMSPRIYGRTDLAKYPLGLKRCRNFIPLVQGALIRRPGTYFVKEVKDSSKQTRLFPFIYSADQAFVLEFGENYIRFYRDYAQVLSGMSALEVTTTYTEAEVQELQIAQQADVVYIAHENHPPAKLSRVTNTSWTLEDLDLEGGPFQRVNSDEDLTVYASADTGSVTLVANFDCFDDDMVGSLFYLENISFKGIRGWEADTDIEIGEKRHNDGRVYEAQSSANNNGTTPPTHFEGEQDDGDVPWLFLHAGLGWGRITEVSSATVATMSVIQRLPEVVGSTNATYKWAKAAFSDLSGYPGCVTFFQQRLAFARTPTQPDTIWMSVAADFENFRAKNKGGLVTAAQAVSVTVASGEVNRIEWLSSESRGLLIGTTGGEGVISARATNEGFGPNNAEYNQQSGYGSAAISAVRANASTVMIQRAQKKIRALSYDFDRDQYTAPDLTILADHVTDDGAFTALAWQQEPHNILWAATVDGRLVGITYNTEQDVTAVHVHTIGGWSDSEQSVPATVESVCVVPSPDSGRDDLWLIVRRYINGGTKRYIEYLKPYWDGSMVKEDAFHVDCGLTYDGTEISTVTGLTHLIGQTVSILADGAVQSDAVVNGSGEVALSPAASVVQVGLHSPSIAEVMPLEAGGRDGPSVGKIKRIHGVAFRFEDTLGGQYGSSDSNLDRFEFRDTSDPMDSSAPLFSGIKVVPWNGDYERQTTIIVKCDQPLPMTLVAVTAQLSTQDQITG